MNTGALGNVATSTQNIPEAKLANLASASNAAKPAPVQTNAAVERANTAPSIDQVKQAVQDINKSFQALSRGLEFTIDEDSNRTIVKVVDQQTKEVIRQLPSQETLEIAKALDQVIGKLIREKA